MLQTKITKMLNIRYPIIVGTMVHLSRAEFIGAISEAGALGILASANYADKEEFRRDVKRVKEMTKNPFAVNLSLFPALRKLENNDYIDVILDEGVSIVETSGHKAPEEYIDRLKKNNIFVIHKCVGVRYAKKAESIGVDAVTVVGFENGGATGTLDITTLCLVPRVVDSLKVPVIAGGGITDGRGIMAILSLGAQGVIMGTRFLLSEECPMHLKVKEALMNASELDTVLVLRSLQNTHRVLKNKVAQTTVEMEARKADLEELRNVITGERTKNMYKTGDIDQGLLPCGQGIGLVKEVKPVKKIIEDLVNEARGTYSNLSMLFKN